MNYTVSEVLQYTEENDIKFIRLAFCDIFGTMKNISIMPGDLKRAFDRGISFDASAVRGFDNVDRSDLFLVPDPATLSILPWRPSHGRVIRMFCSIRRADGTPFECDGRNLLRQAADRAEALGLDCRAGAKSEFYLFKMDENGAPTLDPQDSAGYCDIAPLDRGENVRREICLTLEEMGIYPECSHHEQGPGQNEITFRFSDICSAADNLVTFKSVVKTIAARNGLYASFLPKPLVSQDGSGLHINLSLFRDGVNLFDGKHFKPDSDSGYFLEGILNRIPEITAFLNPLTNSYLRLGHCSAPRYVAWSDQNRTQLVRLPEAQGEYSRMELRSPDSACNPHLAFTLLLQAGLAGIEKKLPLRESAGELAAPTAPGAASVSALPVSLEAALALAEKSDYIRGILPADLLANYFDAKRFESAAAAQAENQHQFDLEQYFEIV